MYRCKECEMVFEELNYISAESFYGVSDEFSNSYNTVGVCPYCNECNYEEITSEELNDGEEVIY
jgi:hypothetical protein